MLLFTLVKKITGKNVKKALICSYGFDHSKKRIFINYFALKELVYRENWYNEQIN